MGDVADRADAGEGNVPDAERLFAELEGGTEGPGGRGRDQEVISQTERPSSRVAEADRAVALAELRAWTEALIPQRVDLEVVSTTDATNDGRAIRLRCLASQRSLMLEFDPGTGMVAVYRDAGLHARLDPYDERSPAGPRRSIMTELDWLCEG
jgi:hypothetical protein